MRKCKFGLCTVNCKTPKQCADFKVTGCGLAITQEQYYKKTYGNNVIFVDFKSINNRMER